MSNLENWGIDGLIKNGGVIILNQKEVKSVEAKVIKSGDKNFEEEKVKMFQPKTLNKEEQLRIVFKAVIKDMLDKIVPTNRLFTGEIDVRLNECSMLLLEEVKIRTKL